ncbi:DUF3168 domain-containing protein [Sphingomonas sp. R1]|uniref:DUF3168 domain-containing protein n=1 Tax=Sphingomonas sp. R1 TaxID=399176 RepID=UPI0022252B49|nr:DUF3168 domain-containing protein [Sphingomonas sp. R1]UYY76657.1 DUF3168 domain-containing protein [Sphingomonas sp. R1]
MSAQEAITGAVRAALAGQPALVAQVNGIFDAPPARTPRPYLLVDDPVLSDWSTKDQDGREVRIAVLVRDTGQARNRVRALAELVEAAIAGMPAGLGEGWQVASCVLVRTRLVAEDATNLTAIVEHRVRMLRDINP